MHSSHAHGPSRYSLVEIGHRLREARKKAELSREAVAQELQVNVDSVGRWERGTNEPRVTQVARLADLYGVSTSWLVGQASHPSGLSPGTVVVDSDCVEAIRALGNGDAAASMSSLSDWLHPPAVLYAVDVPQNPQVVNGQQARALDRELQKYLDRFEE